jgi:hypothetical protein
MRVLRLKERYPTAKVELWCTDEHRLGLKPIVRKVWSPVGERPIVRVHQSDTNGPTSTPSLAPTAERFIGSSSPP